MAEVFGQQILEKAREEFNKNKPKDIALGIPEHPLTPYEALIFLGKKKSD